MMRPTLVQVTAEIEKLKEMKPRVRRMTAFGDDNHAAIDVQIRVLEQDLSNDQIYDRWGMVEYLLDSALEASSWLKGESESLGEEWSGLVR